MQPSADPGPAGFDPDDPDRRFMARALELARRGRGCVHPNPMVGCVVVRDGEVVGEGWHERFGGPHAEPLALVRAGDRARGATVYVSLEPCRHEGKTPACTAALRAAGVARVVYGAADPGAESGGGARELAAAGIDVLGPLLDPIEARRANPAFFHRFDAAVPVDPSPADAAPQGLAASPPVAPPVRPYVTLKLAMSLDARIAARRAEPTPITGPAARAEAHRLRAEADAVVVGVGTVRADDPALTVRHGVAMRRPPIRMVVDSGATLAEHPDGPGALRLAPSTDGAEAAPPTWLFCTEGVAESRIEALKAAGFVVHPVTATPEGRVSLPALLDVCAEAGLTSLLVEGGAQLAAAFLRSGHVHRLALFVAPWLLGAEGVPAFANASGIAGLTPPSDGAPSDGARSNSAPSVGASWHPAAPPVVFGDDVLLLWDRLGALVQPSSLASAESS